MFKVYINYFIVLLLLQSSLQAREINLTNLFINAAKNKKHLLVWMHKTDCGYCEAMKEFTLHNDTIEKLIDNRFIYEHININENDDVIYKDFEGTGRDFAMYMGYNLYPTSYFFDGTGELVYAEIGYADNKYIKNEERFYKILHFVDSKSYMDLEFDEYEYIISEEL